MSRDRVFPGQPLTADALNRIVDAVLDRLRAGPGVYATRVGREVVLSAAAPPATTGGSGLTIDRVTELPPIPGRPRIVWWVDSSRGGTGDNQLWAACPGQSRWTPLQNWTWLTGEPSTGEPSTGEPS